MKKERQSPFEIAGITVEPGTTKTVQTPLHTLPNQTVFSLNMRIIHGKRPGKRLFISSTIHGDELNGIEAIRRVMASPLLKHLKGTLIVVPIVNTIGAIIQSRYLHDRRDLNRCFPGSEKGSSASQLANKFLTEIVARCTHGIDLHTGSGNRINLPQIRCDFQNEETLRIALAFGAPVILKAEQRPGSLRQAAEHLNVPTILFEGGQALRFDEFAIHAATQGILRVMQMLGMIKSRRSGTVKHSPVICPTSRWLRAPNTGFFRTNCTLGKKVSKGDVVGRISDPLGTNTTDVVAFGEGVIIGKLELPLVFQGDALLNIAWVPDPAKAEEIIEEYGESAELAFSLDDPETY
jgi:uncharacterized protein